MEPSSKKKDWTEEERLNLITKLEDELNDYVNNLKKKKYTEGWAEDRWETEMEKHPFFMTKQPDEIDAEASPLLQGLQQLKYGEDENTPEELATNYKEDGNFNYKYKKYRMAILSYTEGIKTKCKDKNLMAQLYNNRAAAHFMLKNYRSSLNDNKRALKLKPDYMKARNRAATCCFHMEQCNECIHFCDELLNKVPTDKAVQTLRAQAVNAREQLKKKQRKQEWLDTKSMKGKDQLLEIIKSKSINFEYIDADCDDMLRSSLVKLQEQIYIDENGKVVWPVMIMYPETKQFDYIMSAREDILLIAQLIDVFKDPPIWDTGRRYTIGNINVYFVGKDDLLVETSFKGTLYKVNIQDPLIKILQDKRCTVAGIPVLLIFVKSSPAERRFLSVH